jgi:hypothetical protein
MFCMVYYDEIILNIDEKSIDLQKSAPLSPAPLDAQHLIGVIPIPLFVIPYKSLLEMVGDGIGDGWRWGQI